MNMKERAKKMVEEYSTTAEHNIFIKEELEKAYSEMIAKFEKNYPESVGASHMNFTGMYMRLAKTVWSKFKKKYLPEQFNAFWNERVQMDERMIFQDEVQVHLISGEHAGPKAVEFKSFPLGVTFGKAKTYVDDFGSGMVFWNNGVTVDEEYIEEQLRSFFRMRILKKFHEEMKAEMEQNEFAEYDSSTFVYLHDEKNVANDMRIKALEYFGGITVDRIINYYFKKYAEEENLTLERYNKVKILIGLGDKLYEALM